MPEPLSEGRGEGRVAPHDLDAEASVLGSILLQPETVARIIWLRPEDFYRMNHAEVYRAMLELYRRGEPIDIVVLADELSHSGLLERIGGRAHLHLLRENVATAANVEHYARIVREKAQRRGLIRAGTELVDHGFDETRETLAAVGDAQRVVFDLTGDQVTSEPEHIKGLLQSFLDNLDSLKHGEMTGLATGFPDLDRYLKGLKGGDLIIAAGSASMGKTVFALNVGHRVALAGKGVAVFSLEMSKDQVVHRLVAMQAQIDKDRLERNLLSEAEYDRLMAAMEPLEQMPFLVDEQSFLDELTLAAKARSLMIKQPVDLVIVDYLQLVKSSRDFRGNRVQEVAWVSASLKALARELKVPVLALSQLSRAPSHREDKRPVLSDLRESGSLEQDADIVLGIYRDEYFRGAKSDAKGIAEVLVLKHRNGPTGTVKLRFQREHQRFDPLDQHHTHPAPEAVAASANGSDSSEPWD